MILFRYYDNLNGLKLQSSCITYHVTTLKTRRYIVLAGSMIAKIMKMTQQNCEKLNLPHTYDRVLSWFGIATSIKSRVALMDFKKYYNIVT